MFCNLTHTFTITLYKLHVQSHKYNKFLMVNVWMFSAFVVQNPFKTRKPESANSDFNGRLFHKTGFWPRLYLYLCESCFEWLFSFYSSFSHYYFRKYCIWHQCGVQQFNRIEKVTHVSVKPYFEILTAKEREKANVNQQLLFLILNVLWHKIYWIKWQFSFNEICLKLFLWFIAVFGHLV